jgi:hypothetical protein
LTLEERIRDVLARLSTLSEAPAAGTLAAVATPSSLPKEQRAESDRKAKTPKRHHESSIPAGVSLHAVDPDRPPSKERSLFDYYAWKFARLDLETEAHKARVTVLLAERDHERRIQPNAHTKALRSGALLGDNAEGKIAEEVQIRRVIEDYKGVPAIEVGIFEETTEEWVKKARRIMSCDVDTGHPRPPFLDWSEDDRRREAAKLHRRGMGQKKAADRLGIAKSTLQRYWPQPATVAA